MSQRRKIPTIWSLGPADVLDKDYDARVILDNDTFTSKESIKSYGKNEKHHHDEVRVLEKPWKPATNIKECKVKFTHARETSDGKAIVERGLCAGIKDGKPIVYEVFSRTDYSVPYTLKELKSTSERQSSFAREATRMAFGINDIPNAVKFKDKTDYKKLLGLN